jgi:hypothetical protein
MQELVPRLWDDLDFRSGKKTEAQETLTIGIDGWWVEVDLTDEHAKQLRDAVMPLMEAGRRLREPPKPVPDHKAGTVARGPAHGKAMRSFADAHGLQDDYKKKSDGSGYSYSTKLKRAYAAAVNGVEQEQPDS